MRGMDAPPLPTNHSRFVAQTNLRFRTMTVAEAILDLDSLLLDLSVDAPCGEDLEYDPAFGELERSAEGKPEQQFGDTIVEAEDLCFRNRIHGQIPLER